MIAPTPAQLPLSANGIGSTAIRPSTCWGPNEQASGVRASTAGPLTAYVIDSRSELDRTMYIMYELVR